MTWNEPGPGRDPWNQGPKGSRGDAGVDLSKYLKYIRNLLGSSSSGPNKPRGLAYGVIVLIVAAWLVSGFYTIDAQDRGVKLRFGAVVGNVGPGLGWHLPWPIASIEKVNVTKLRQASIQSTLLTKNENLVDVGLTVQFRVSSVSQYLFDVADPDDTLSQAAKSVLRRVVSHYDIADILGDQQEKIANSVKERLQRILDHYGCGLYLVDVSLSQVQPPDKVQDAFADAIKAQSDQRALIEAAQTYAKDRLPQARNQAAEKIANAQSYKLAVIARAAGSATRFGALLSEYRRAPKLMRDRLYIETLAGIMHKSRVVVYGEGVPPTVMINMGGKARRFPGGRIAPRATQTSGRSQTPAAGSGASSGTTGNAAGTGAGSSSGGSSNSRSRNRGGSGE